jgi:hypothetical protein
MNDILEDIKKATGLKKKVLQELCGDEMGTLNFEREKRENPDLVKNMLWFRGWNMALWWVLAEIEKEAKEKGELSIGGGG